MAVVTLVGCNKDEESPSITVNSPDEHHTFTAYDNGTSFTVDATFADDQDLATYSVEIGDADGNHIHEFHNDDSGTISGTSYNYTNTIDVPDSLSLSMFYLHFTVTDAMGKSTTLKWMLHYQ